MKSVMNKRLFALAFITTNLMIAISFQPTEAKVIRRKRASTAYVIANTTFACPATNALYSFNDEQLSAIFQSLGGQFNPTYMARNQKEAEKFPNLLPIPFALYPSDRTKVGILNQLKESKESRLLHVPDKTSTSSSLTNIPNKMSTSSSLTNGSVSVVDYCINRGTPSDGHLSLCTICSATTTYPSFVWPYIVNEAHCSSTDPYCFFVEGVEQGLCVVSEMPLNFMCRTQSECTLYLVDGSTVIAEAWELCTIPIRVGCSCTINENSYFANFV